MLLPDDKVAVNDKLRFVSLNEKEVNLHIPARAFVKAIGDPFQAKFLAERYLKDFIGLYSNIVSYPIRVVRDDGGSEIPSEFFPAETEYLSQMSPSQRLVVKPLRSKRDLNRSLRFTAKLMNLLDLHDGTKSYLRIAIDYLLSSRTSERDEDSLINCMIAIEALFGGRDELKYRISHRVASLLGKNDGSREEIFTTMKKLYDKRSDIVHGRKTELTLGDVRAGQSYLSDAIDYFLALSQKYSRENIHLTLDKAVINNKKREEFQKECDELVQKTMENVD